MSLDAAFALFPQGIGEIAVAGWEARHSLFVQFLLFGSISSALVLAAAPAPARAREWLIVALSLGNVALLGNLRLAGAVLGFSLAFYAAVDLVPGRAGALAAWSLIALLLVYPVVGPRDLLTGNDTRVLEFWAFATNVWWLRSIAYLMDRRWRGTPRRSLREFLLATLFFPTFLNGPIESTEQLAAHRFAGPAVASWRELAARGRELPGMLARLAWGSAKVLLGVFYLGQDNAAVFATSGHILGHPRLWLWVIELYATFYVIFSGWSDVAIVLARFSGYRVGENFDRPWRARSVADFWRRWHISFGVWLRDNVYIPLGGNRRHAELNVLLTFLFSGLWHVWGALKALDLRLYPPRAWLGFVVWGVANGLAVIAGRWWARASVTRPARDLLRSALPDPLRARAAQALAFGFVALAWIPFFLPPWVDVVACWEILLRVVWLA